jgi:hypothetical protein
MLRDIAWISLKSSCTQDAQDVWLETPSNHGIGKCVGAERCAGKSPTVSFVSPWRSTQFFFQKFMPVEVEGTDSEILPKLSVA